MPPLTYVVDYLTLATLLAGLPLYQSVTMLDPPQKNAHYHVAGSTVVFSCGGGEGGGGGGGDATSATAAADLILTL